MNRHTKTRPVLFNFTKKYFFFQTLPCNCERKSEAVLEKLVYSYNSHLANVCNELTKLYKKKGLCSQTGNINF